MTPEVKVFLYLVTMDDAMTVVDSTQWQERYHLQPQRLLNKLINHHYLTQVVAGYELTAKGREALADISDWLWIHQYYLPGVVDFTTAKHKAAHSTLRGYKLVVALLQDTYANAVAASDNDYCALLLRQQLKLEFSTHHDDPALHTLMQLIYRELDVSAEVSLENFNYETSWLKITNFEKQLLTELLARMALTVDDFEMAFAQWLQTVPSQARFFTNFEVMTIVMYELGNDQARLNEVYQAAAMRRLNQEAATSLPPSSAQGFG